MSELVQAQQVHLVDNVMANDRIAREFGLGLTDMQTLHLLLLRPEVSTAKEVAEIAGLPTSTVTDIVDRLERAGLDAYSSLGQTLDDVAAGFSEDELRVVLRWFQALSAASSADPRPAS